MIGVKSLLVCLVVVLAVVCGSPVPGGLGGHHEHHVIHVPYNVHTIHHHHVKKVVVPVPIVKKVFVEPLIHAPIAPIAPIIGHGGWW